jgi:hypothetical protein
LKKYLKYDEKIGEQNNTITKLHFHGIQMKTTSNLNTSFLLLPYSKRRLENICIKRWPKLAKYFREYNHVISKTN